MTHSPPEQKTSRPAPTPAQKPPAPEDLNLEGVKVKAREYLEGWQRARADYENLQKRLQSELAAATDAGKEEMLRDLFPLVDAFEAALTSLPREWNMHPWAEGLARIQEALHSLLESAGVTSVGETDTPFDASRHEAVAEGPSELAVGTVTTILARGYSRNGRLLRPAKVKVSSGPAAPPTLGRTTSQSTATGLT